MGRQPKPGVKDVHNSCTYPPPLDSLEEVLLGLPQAPLTVLGAGPHPRPQRGPWGRRDPVIRVNQGLVLHAGPTPFPMLTLAGLD